MRTIQQSDLPVSEDPSRRVVGMGRPTVEILGSLSKTGHIGVMGTPGTISTGSYHLEIAKIYPDMTVTGKAWPASVPLVRHME